MMNLGQRRIARISRAKPRKNSLPAAASRMEVSSANDAPAQNGPVPSLRSTITRASGFAASSSTVAARPAQQRARQRVPLGVAEAHGGDAVGDGGGERAVVGRGGGDR
jgi:hypothetical protein